MTEYRQPELLDGTHILDEFTCRSTEQTDWLRRLGRQSAGAGTTKVFVVTELDEPHVVAYYGWCMAQVTVDDAPHRFVKGGGRYPQPVALLARLGVDLRHERRGLGAALLIDVFTRLVALDTTIGCRGLLVHCESTDARAFYQRIAPFEQSPTDELHLTVLMKDIRATLG